MYKLQLTSSSCGCCVGVKPPGRNRKEGGEITSTVNILVDSMAHLQLTPELKANRDLMNTIRDALVFKNPEYDQAFRRRGYPPAGIDPEIKTYIFNREIGILSVPRGFLDQLLQLLSAAGFETPLTNRRAAPPIIDDIYHNRIRLRPYQQPAIDHMGMYNSGMLIAPCGSGKTTMGLQLIADRLYPALWVTHTKRLARQTEERARELLGLTEIGKIEDGEVNISPGLTIALVQTLAKQDLGDLANRWGTVIYDEAHHLPATSFAKVANSISAKYRYGLTANTARADGLYPIVLRLIGPIRYEITQAEVEQAGGTITPELIRVETGRKYRDKRVDPETKEPTETDYQFAGKMVKAIAEDQTRNELVCATIAKQEPGSRTLVLVQLVEHAETLAEMLRDYYGLKAAAFHGGLTPKQSARIDRDFRDGKLQIMVGTLGLAKEGLDYPFLTALHLVAPMRDPEGIKQAVGRVARSHPGKTRAVVYDYVDGHVCADPATGPGLLANQAKDRMRVYRKLGMAKR